MRYAREGRLHQVGRPRTRAVVRREMYVTDVQRSQNVPHVLREGFVLSYVVVSHDARHAQLVARPPVGVELRRLRRQRIENVLDELAESDVISASQRLSRRVLAVASHDPAPVSLVEVYIVCLREFVDVRR